jgi:hypothetical protein
VDGRDLGAWEFGYVIECGFCFPRSKIYIYIIYFFGGKNVSKIFVSDKESLQLVFISRNETVLFRSEFDSVPPLV